MDESTVQLTVFFEDPFWVGVLERREAGELTVCRIVFGAEPRDAQVYALILQRYHRLSFGPPVADVRRQAADNPKRRQRNAQKQLQTHAVGTKAQQALQLQREAQKQQSRRRARAEAEAEKQRRFVQKQQKRREKHRGH